MAKYVRIKNTESNIKKILNASYLSGDEEKGYFPLLKEKIELIDLFIQEDSIDIAAINNPNYKGNKPNNNKGLIVNMNTAMDNISNLQQEMDNTVNQVNEIKNNIALLKNNKANITYVDSQIEEKTISVLNNSLDFSRCLTITKIKNVNEFEISYKKNDIKKISFTLLEDATENEFYVYTCSVENDFDSYGTWSSTSGEKGTTITILGEELWTTPIKFIIYDTTIEDRKNCNVEIEHYSNPQKAIDNTYEYIDENIENVANYVDSKVGLAKEESKVYTNEKATLEINTSHIYYTDEDNSIYVFGDQYLEIPEEFEGKISEIIVSKEPGDTAPYIQVSFYDVEYNLIETIEILPEFPDEDGNNEFINVSKEVNITGAAYVMGSDGGCSLVGTLTLINKTQTSLGEEVNEKDKEVLESAKNYTNKTIKEEIKFAKEAESIYSYKLTSKNWSTKDIFAVNISKNNGKTELGFSVHSDEKLFENGAEIVFYNPETGNQLLGVSNGYLGPIYDEVVGSWVWEFSMEVNEEIPSMTLEEFLETYTYYGLYSNRYFWESKDKLKEEWIGDCVALSSFVVEGKDVIVSEDENGATINEFIVEEIPESILENLRFIKISMIAWIFDDVNYFSPCKNKEYIFNDFEINPSKLYDADIVFDLKAEKIYRVFFDGTYEEIFIDSDFETDGFAFYKEGVDSFASMNDFFSLIKEMDSCLLQVTNNKLKMEFYVLDSVENALESNTKDTFHSLKKYTNRNIEDAKNEVWKVCKEYTDEQVRMPMIFNAVQNIDVIDFPSEIIKIKNIKLWFEKTDTSTPTADDVCATSIYLYKNDILLAQTEMEITGEQYCIIDEETEKASIYNKTDNSLISEITVSKELLRGMRNDDCNKMKLLQYEGSEFISNYIVKAELELLVTVKAVIGNLNNTIEILKQAIIDLGGNI